MVIVMENRVTCAVNVVANFDKIPVLEVTVLMSKSFV
ncbi:hypothetical protein AmaxDRAFT_3966 [Limnospira maxima CS-328]|uniref:Uncharacterized protein n=1 Tax=Limnospira maxima CS-328 TaxID=513049 RepID=B5W5C1_LIMMA|nr:hypothetical protein AmaxDRAFT_3966 [Limnospira maxima CS-328]